MAAANREAVYAQAETFPIIRELEAASRLGQAGSYVMLDKEGNPRIDPKTGKTIIREYDFSGQGDVDLTRQIAQATNELADPQAAAQLAVAQKYGRQFAAQRRSELQEVDPTRYALYENFLQDLKSGNNQIPEDTVESPSYERVGMPGGPQDTGEAARIRSNLERQISSGLAQAGTLDPAMIRGAEQAARARGTSTGNLLGNLSAFREARAVNEAISNADVQRRQQALGLLQSGQTSSDVANRRKPSRTFLLPPASGTPQCSRALLVRWLLNSNVKASSNRTSPTSNPLSVSSRSFLKPPSLVISSRVRLRLLRLNTSKVCSRPAQVSCSRLDPASPFRTLRISFKPLKLDLRWPFLRVLQAQ